MAGLRETILLELTSKFYSPLFEVSKEVFKEELEEVFKKVSTERLARLRKELCIQASLISHKGQLSLFTDVAIAFSNGIRAVVTKAELRLIIIRNHCEENTDICASHDFCDANQVMYEVLIEMVPGEWDPCDSAITNLINVAWAMAKASNFGAANVEVISS